MGPFVVDASVAAAWGIPDELNPITETLRQAVADSFAIAPAIFPVELQNILWTAERRGRVTALATNSFWDSFCRLDIRIQCEISLKPEPILLEISRIHALSSYDASYLELARSTGLPLATLDRGLRSVAHSLGIAVLPPTVS